jgi:predicted TIM-barrel fold metal-dependent hydrolase
MRTGITSILCLLCLFAAGQSLAQDASIFSSAPPEILDCMESKLAADLMEQVRAGIRPMERNSRKMIREAYEACLSADDHPRYSRYDGPLFDAMSQIDETVDADAAIRNVREAGVVKLALFARSRKRLHDNEQAALDLAKRNPDLIVLGAPKFFQLSKDVSGSYISATVDGIREHGYRFIGELLYTHGDKQTGKRYEAGERYVDPSEPGTARLLEAIAPLNIPFMAHWEPYAPERDFPRFHALYSAWPDQTFLLPHMGFASVDQLDEFMRRHPNLFLLTSKKERFMDDFADPGKQKMIGQAMLDGDLLRPEWKELLIRYQDRILFATDPHMKKLWMKYGEVVGKQRLILGQLPREAAEKIAHKNAEQIYGVRLNETWTVR